MKEHLIVPNILLYQNAGLFFKDLIRLNKEQKKSISGRTISKSLSWPPSLIVDLIKERKSLTTHRAIEFARWAKLGEIETERLLWISLMETGDQQTKFFCQRKLALNPNDYLLPTLSIISPDLYFYLDLVIGILLIKQKKLAAQEIKKLINNKKIPINKIKKVLSMIWDLKILEYNDKKNIIIQKKQIQYDNHNIKDGKNFEGLKIHQDYSNNFLEFMQNPLVPSTYMSGCAILSREQFHPVALQLFEIRNWILSIHQDNLKKIENSHLLIENLRLLQFDLNLFKVNK